MGGSRIVLSGVPRLMFRFILTLPSPYRDPQPYIKANVVCNPARRGCSLWLPRLQRGRILSSFVRRDLPFVGEGRVRPSGSC